MYDKHTGSLTGYSGMGEANNLFTELEQDKKSSTSKRPLAKCVLVFMVKGIFTSLKFPMPIFPLQALQVLSYMYSRSYGKLFIELLNSDHKS